MSREKRSSRGVVFFPWEPSQLEVLWLLCLARSWLQPQLVLGFPQAIGSTLIQFPLTDRELSPNSPLSTSGSNYV